MIVGVPLIVVRTGVTVLGRPDSSTVTQRSVGFAADCDWRGRSLGTGAFGTAETVSRNRSSHAAGARPKVEERMGRC